MRFLKTNTAVRITVGPFLDHADGLTPLDAMTVTDIACILTQDSDDNDAVAHQHLTLSASAGDNDIVTAGGGGLWDLELTAANVNFLGRAMLCFTDADQICPVFHEFTVLAANVYDSLYAGHGVTADLLDVSLAQILGHAITQSGTQVADAFQAFFDVATPTGTVNSLPAAIPGANGGLPTTNGTKLSQTVDLTTAQLALKKNTAFPNFTFLMVDSSGVPLTGLTVTSTRRIDAGSFAACANAATEVAYGMYTIDFANTDLNGAMITLRFTAAGASDRFIGIVTQA
jgi:hypothetical protein